MSLTDTPDITVNGHVIPAADIDAEVQYHPSETRREAMVKAAEALIIAELLAQKAEEAGLANDVNRNIVDEHPEIIDKLLDQEVHIPKATNEECLRYFEANPEKFTTEPLIEANHILLPAEPKDLELRAEKLQLAEAILEQLEEKQETFSELAKRYSACPSKELGGSLGQLSYGQTVSEFERQVFAAEEGLMSSPVESRFGYHIVFIARKVAGKPLSFDMVQEKIQKYLDDKVHRKAVSQYLNRIAQEATIDGYQMNSDESASMQ